MLCSKHTYYPDGTAVLKLQSPVNAKLRATETNFTFDILFAFMDVTLPCKLPYTF